MTVTETERLLAAAGIVRPAEVIELAAAARLELAAAVVMLTKESSGGHNLWGRDGVSTGGVYTKGGPVTRISYERYRDLVRARQIGRQGVGPTQLTYGPLQDEADRRGGCWDWRTNVAVGFEHLASLIRAHGERGGFRRYNGSGAAAEVYAERSIKLLETWRQRLAAAAPRPPAPAQPADLVHGMRDHAEVRRLQEFLRDNFPGYAGDLPATGHYLDQTAAAIAEFQRRVGVRNPDGSRPDGRNVGSRTRAALAAHGYR